MKKVIELTPAEIQSGVTRVKWAEGLIRQLPEHHEGRNSWLLNYSAVYEFDQDPWNGEGLPPVGLEVEVCDSDEPHEAYARHIGEKVRIIAHDVLNGDDEGLPVAVYSYDCSWGKGYHALVAGKFRPIRTAEQIAAEERKGQVNKMLDLFEVAACGREYDMRAGIEAIYDAGYGKVEQ